VLTLLAEQALHCQDFKASYIHCQDLMAAGKLAQLDSKSHFTFYFVLIQIRNALQIFRDQTFFFFFKTFKLKSFKRKFLSNHVWMKLYSIISLLHFFYMAFRPNRPTSAPVSHSSCIITVILFWSDKKKIFITMKSHYPCDIMIYFYM